MAGLEILQGPGQIQVFPGVLRRPPPAEQGAVEGVPADLPAAPQFVPGWQIGRPDEIIEAAKPYTLPASGSDMYWNFIFRTPVDRTRWLRAIEIRPGDKRVVHHANILVDRNQSARRMEAEPRAGFPGMELKIESETFDPDSHFFFWKPGTVPRPEPEGMSLRLDKDTDLVLNMHLQPSGKAEKIQPNLGLYFTNQPARLFPLLLQLENDRQLDIPPGEKHFLVTDEITLPVDVDLLELHRARRIRGAHRTAADGEELHREVAPHVLFGFAVKRGEQRDRVFLLDLLEVLLHRGREEGPVDRRRQARLCLTTG